MATSYANNGGTGERRPEIVVTSTFVSAGTDIGAGASYTADELLVFVDGLTSGGLGNGNPSREFGNANNDQDRNVTFDFGVGATIVIDEIKIYISGTSNFGTKFTIEGSNNGSSWTVLKTTFNITGNSSAGTAYSFTNTTTYRYYRLRVQGVGSVFGGGTGSWSEFEFKLDDQTPQSSRTSWFNTGGKGNRGAFITPTTTLTLGTGAIANAIDGDYTNNASHAFAPTAGQTTKEIKFDFGSGVSVTIDTIAIWTAAGPGNSDGSWKTQGSPDNSTWTDLDTTGNLFDTGNGYLLTKRTFANTTGYRYYRLLQTSGTTSTLPSITEIEFRITGFNIILAKAYKLSGYAVAVPANAKPYKLSGYAVIVPPAAPTAGIVVVIATG